MKPMNAMREAGGAVLAATFTNKFQPLGEPICRSSSNVSQHIQHLHCFFIHINNMFLLKISMKTIKEKKIKLPAKSQWGVMVAHVRQIRSRGLSLPACTVMIQQCEWINIIPVGDWNWYKYALNSEIICFKKGKVVENITWTWCWAELMMIVGGCSFNSLAIFFSFLRGDDWDSIIEIREKRERDCFF